MTTTVAITNPVVTQVISSTVAPSDPVRCGVATATIDVSIAPIKVPNVTDSVTIHLLTGARAGATGAMAATLMRACPRGRAGSRPAGGRARTRGRAGRPGSPSA